MHGIETKAKQKANNPKHNLELLWKSIYATANKTTLRRKQKNYPKCSQKK